MKAEKKVLGAYGHLRHSDYRMLAEFRYVLRKFVVFSEAAARDVGLAPQQHQALLAIKGFGGEGDPAIGDLAQFLSIRHHSAVGLAGRLVRAKLLIRKADPADRRRVTLRLTQKAEDLLAELTAAHRDELRRLAPTLRAALAQVE